MKYSKYNSLFPYKERYILYNSFTNRVLVLDESLKKLLDRLENDISTLEYLNPELYKTILEKSFWVDDDIDELDLVKRNIEREINNDEKYSLTINPTLDCNFKCWYCYEDHIKGSKVSQIGIDKIKNCIIKIFEENVNLKHFALTFFGGEPLLYFQKVCLSLINKWSELSGLYNVKKTLTFTTNGYLVNERMISQLQEHADYTHLQITLDGYKDFHNKVRYTSSLKESYDKIITNITMLVNNGFNVRLRINYTPDNIESCSKILKDLDYILLENKSKLSISFHCVWQENHRMNDKQNELFTQMNYFTEAGFFVDSSIHLRSYEQICYADKKNSAVINFNGDVFKCTARNFETGKREGVLTENGEIIWDDDKILLRMKNFTNEPCLSCRILPHCFGSCSQVRMEALDSKNKYCVYGFNQNKIDSVILNHILQFLKI